jgi:hypothetical protein
LKLPFFQDLLILEGRGSMFLQNTGMRLPCNAVVSQRNVILSNITVKTSQLTSQYFLGY